MGNELQPQMDMSTTDQITASLKQTPWTTDGVDVKSLAPTSLF